MLYIGYPLETFSEFESVCPSSIQLSSPPVYYRVRASKESGAAKEVQLRE